MSKTTNIACVLKSGFSLVCKMILAIYNNNQLPEQV